jgi:aminoglycoside 6'-N-acetyltransferase I
VSSPEPDSRALSIINLVEQPELTEAAARALIEGFRELAPNAWPDMEAALRELTEAQDPERICRAALDTSGRLLGWIGGIPQYDGHVWELHPLVVLPSEQRKGVGSALIHDFESQVAARGGITIMLGTDDETGMTTLSDRDLYPDPLIALLRVANRDPARKHPFSFYRQHGFIPVGVIPDANGPGKPDILMAKRVHGVG